MCNAHVIHQRTRHMYCRRGRISPILRCLENFLRNCFHPAKGFHDQIDPVRSKHTLQTRSCYTHLNQSVLHKH